MLNILCLVWIALAVSDAGHTIHMLNKHGIEIEINSAIRKLCSWWGVTRGVIAGVFIPTCAIAELSWLFHLETFMAIIVALRITLFALQLKYHFNVKSAL